MIAKDTPDNLTREMVEKNGIHLVAKEPKIRLRRHFVLFRAFVMSNTTPRMMRER